MEIGQWAKALETREYINEIGTLKAIDAPNQLL